MKKRAVLLVTVSLWCASARADDAWERLGSKHGAVVDVRRGKVPRVRTTAELPVAADAVAAVLADLERYPTRFPDQQGWEVVRTKDAVFAYGYYALPWPLDARDYYVRYTTGKEGDVFTVRANSAPGRPEVKGRVRLSEVASAWRVEPRGPARCVVSYWYDVPAPGIPDAALEGMWKSEGPGVLRALHAEVRKRATVLPPPPAVTPTP